MNSQLIDFIMMVFALCLFLLIAYIVWRCFISRKPIKRGPTFALAVGLMSVLIIGMLATAPSAGIYDFLESVGLSSDFIVVGIVPFYEEAFKAVAVVVVLRSTWVRKWQWLSAGALAGFGFGMVENVFLYSRNIFLTRMVTSLPLHMLQSALVGLGVYLAYTEGKKGWIKLGLLYACAVGIHSAWNYLA